MKTGIFAKKGTTATTAEKNAVISEALRLLEDVDLNGWIQVSDSKLESDVVVRKAPGLETTTNGGAWKIHMSIEPDKMSQAIEIILNEVLKDGSPRVAIKFASDMLLKSPTSQPGKQVAMELEDGFCPNKVKELLQNIGEKLKANDIQPESRPINSIEEYTIEKWDATIPHSDGSVSYFYYRNHRAVVMPDELFDGPLDDSYGEYAVRESYYLSLPESQRHNPTHAVDPLSTLTIDFSAPVNATQDEVEPLDTLAMGSSARVFTPQVNATQALQQPAKIDVARVACEAFLSVLKRHLGDNSQESTPLIAQILDSLQKNGPSRAYSLMLEKQPDFIFNDEVNAAFSNMIDTIDHDSMLAKSLKEEYSLESIRYLSLV